MVLLVSITDILHSSFDFPISLRTMNPVGFAPLDQYESKWNFRDKKLIVRYHSIAKFLF